MNIITVEQAAEKLGMSIQTLRVGLQQGDFPFGKAIMTTKPEDSKTGRGRFTYYINPERLEIYLKGEDMYEH